MTATLLRILDLFRPLFTSQGIDYMQMRAIVGIKLEMDNRRVSAHRFQQATEANAAFAWTIFVYFILGGFLSIMLIFLPSLIFTYTIYHAYLMVMVTMTLISDFSSVLLDTSDNTIVLPRPISNKTFYAARTTHILLYIGLISLALAAIPLVTSFIVHGPLLGLALVATTLLTVFFSVALTNGLYLLLMRFTSEERLKNLINYFQIAMAILMTGGYQILPRFFSKEIVENLSTTLPWWSLFIPPMWMASVLQMVSDWHVSWISLSNIILAIGVPILTWKAVNQYLTPYFTQKLADLGISSSNQNLTKDKVSSSIHARGHSITHEGLQRAAYNLASFAFARDRKLKLRMYPAFGYFIVLVFVFIFRDKSNGISWTDYLQKIGESQLHLIAIYACIYIIIAASYEIHFTDDFKAAWIFQTAPIQKPGDLLIGTQKSIFVRFFLPIYGLASVFVLSIWHTKALADLIFGFLTCLLLMLVIGLVGDKHLPMSLPTTVRAQGSSMARALFIFIALGAIGVGHYFLSKIDFALWIGCPLIVALILFLLTQYKKVKWDNIGI